MEQQENNKKIDNGKSLLPQLLNYKNYISVNKQFIKLFGASASILLTELISWENMLVIKEEIKPGDFFFFLQDSIEYDIGLSKKSQLNALNKLSSEEINIIEIKKRGIPCKNYYKINYSRIEEILSIGLIKNIPKGYTGIDQKDNQGSTKGVLINNIKNNNIKNKKILSKDNSDSKKSQLNNNCIKIIEKIKSLFKDIKHLNGKKVFSHILPIEDKEPTSLIKKLNRIILSIKAGSFYDFYCKRNLDKAFIKEHNITNLPLLSKEKTWEETEEIILKSLNEYKSYFTSNTLEVYKKRLLTDNLEAFFYHRGANKSYFMSCLCNPINNRIALRIERIKSSMTDIIKQAEALYSTNFNEVEFWKNIRDVYRWHQDYNKQLREHNYKICDECGGNYDRSIGNINLFFNTYISFLKNVIKTYQLGNIGINKTFDWFKNWCWKQTDPFALDTNKTENPYESYDYEADMDFGEIEADIAVY